MRVCREIGREKRDRLVFVKLFRTEDFEKEDGLR